MSNEQKQQNNTTMILMETKRKRGQPKKQPTKVVGVRVLSEHYQTAHDVANKALQQYKQNTK